MMLFIMLNCKYKNRGYIEKYIILNIIKCLKAFLKYFEIYNSRGFIGYEKSIYMSELLNISEKFLIDNPLKILKKNNPFKIITNILSRENINRYCLISDAKNKKEYIPNENNNSVIVNIK